MELVTIDTSNISLLKTLIGNLGGAAGSFRYFNSRPVTVIDQHLYTVIALEGETPAGYGHLDTEAGVVWLGICILPAFQKKGLGKKIMEALIAAAKNKSVREIYLTVDNDNDAAIKLYEYFNFKQTALFDSYAKYRLPLI